MPDVSGQTHRLNGAVSSTRPAAGPSVDADSVSRGRRVIGRVWSSLVVAGVTIAVYLIRLPGLDLPVWDDANYYHNGWRLLHEGGRVLNIQWAPAVAFLTAGFNLLFGPWPIVGYYVYWGLAYVLLSLGLFSLLRSFGAAARWAVLVTCCVGLSVQGTSFNSPMHLLANAMVLLVLAYFFRAAPPAWPVALGLIVLAFLVRNESVLVLVPSLMAAAWRRRNRGERVWEHSRRATAVLGLVLGFMFIVMAQDRHFFDTGRFNFAFRQKFFAYARETGRFQAKGAWEIGNQDAVIARVFGDDASTAPVISLLLRNPQAVLGFVSHNLSVLAREDLVAGQHALSQVLRFAFVVGVLAATAVPLRRRAWWLVLVVAVLIVRFPPALLTSPELKYFLDVTLIGALAVWLLVWPRKGHLVVVALGLLICALSLPALSTQLRSGVPHRLHQFDRAVFVRDAVARHHLEGLRLAEYFAPFSQTFGTRSLGGSAPLLDTVLKDGRLVSSGGQPCDLVLIEAGQRPYLPAHIAKWISQRQTIAVEPPFALYQQ